MDSLNSVNDIRGNLQGLATSGLTWDGLSGILAWTRADVMKLVDMPVLEAGGVTHVGSSPTVRIPVEHLGAVR